MARRAGPSSSPSSAPSSARRSAVARADRAAAVLGVAALIGVGGWVAAASLQQDLAAYVTAGRARAAGLDPYRNHLPTPGAPWDGVAVYRHSRFLYPPIVAEAFRPLAALPYAWSKILFTAASIAGLALGLRLARRSAVGEPGDGAGARASSGRGASRTDGASQGDGISVLRGNGVALLAAASWPPVFTALERGQIDLLVLPLLALAWRRRASPLVAGPALALCVLAKPFVLATWPLLIVARHLRLTLTAMGAVVALLGLGAVVSGPALCREYLTEVLPRAMLHGEGGPDAWLLPEDALERAGDGLTSGTAQLDAGGRVLAQQLGDFRRNASVVRLLGGDGPPPAPASAIIFGALGALLAIAATRRPESPGWFWGALLAGVAAAPVAWAMSLTFALPLLVLAPAGLAAPAGLETQARAAGSGAAIAAAVTFAAGLAGPWIPGAWCLAAVAGVVTGALLPAHRIRA